MKILTENQKEDLKYKLHKLTDLNLHNEARLLITKELMLIDLHNFYCDCMVMLDETDQEEKIRRQWFDKRYVADQFLWTIAPCFKECF
jgi:hypothetical protein